MTNQDTFTAALKYMIHKKRVTQEELAQAVGYTNQKSVSALIHGRTKGSEQKRRAIAEFFGLSYENFLKIGSTLNENKDSETLEYKEAVIKLIEEKLQNTVTEIMTEIRALLLND